MATLSTQTTVTSNVNSFVMSLNKNLSLTTTGNDTIGGTVSLTGSAWVQITTGSLADIIQVYVAHNGAEYSSSVIGLALSSSGENPVARLIPGSSVVLPWSGSLNGLYGRVIGAWNVDSDSAFEVASKNGSVQFIINEP